MTAGVPGLGLSGLFVIMSVALMLPARLARGRPHNVHPVRTVSIGAMAVVIAASIWLTWQLTIGGRAPQSTGDGSIGDAIRAPGVAGDGPLHAILSTPAIVISLAIVVGLIACVELLALVLPTRKTQTEPPVLRILRDPSANLASTATPAGVEPSPGRSVDQPAVDPGLLARLELAITRSEANVATASTEAAQERDPAAVLAGLTERVGRVFELLLERAEADRRERRELMQCLTTIHDRFDAHAVAGHPQQLLGHPVGTRSNGRG